MTSNNRFEETDASMADETLFIDLKNRRLRSDLAIFKFVASDTQMPMIYAPSIEVTGYGDTFEEASVIMEFNMKEFFNYLGRLPVDKIHDELSNLGWYESGTKMLYFRPFSDVMNQLKEINAEGNKIERITYEAA